MNRRSFINGWSIKTHRTDSYQTQTIMSYQTQQQPSQQQQKIVTVFGATGKQGGAVVWALLKDGHYKVRGVSRTRDAQKAQRLQEKGVEIIKANITGEGLDHAFKGAHAAFLITPSFDNEIEGKEYEYGRLLVDKAKEHGVKVLIWSTLPHAHKLSGGKYHVPHFTEKAKVEEYIRNIQKGKDAFESALFVAPAFYYQNFSSATFSPKKDESGAFVFRFPKIKTLAAVDINDLGHLIVKILQNPHAFNNKTILLEGECAPPQEYVHKFQQETGQQAHLKEISHEELEASLKHHRKELSEMFAFMDEYTYFGQEKGLPHFLHAREIYPQVKNWETYLRETGWKGEHHPKS